MKKALIILGIALCCLLGLAKIWSLVFIQFSVKQTVYAVVFLGGAFALYKKFRLVFPPKLDAKTGSPIDRPTNLIASGWTPYRFPNSDVVVILPPDMKGALGEDGTFYGFSTGDDPDFTATLHAEPQLRQRPEFALEFVTHLAGQKGAQVLDQATYRYFCDPKKQIEGTKEHEFWTIGIPGAFVVISFTRQAGSALPKSLQEVRDAIPRIIAKLG